MSLQGGVPSSAYMRRDGGDREKLIQDILHGNIASFLAKWGFDLRKLFMQHIDAGGSLRIEIHHPAVNEYMQLCTVAGKDGRYPTAAQVSTAIFERLSSFLDSASVDLPEDRRRAMAIEAAALLEHPPYLFVGLKRHPDGIALLDCQLKTPEPLDHEGGKSIELQLKEQGWTSESMTICVNPHEWRDDPAAEIGNIRTQIGEQADGREYVVSRGNHRWELLVYFCSPLDEEAPQHDLCRALEDLKKALWPDGGMPSCIQFVQKQPPNGDFGLGRIEYPLAATVRDGVYEYDQYNLLSLETAIDAMQGSTENIRLYFSEFSGDLLVTWVQDGDEN